MHYSPILAPVVALVAWTLIVQIWLYATRFPAMKRAGISLKGRVGSRGAQLDGVIDDKAQWKAHNYNHLLEQPTIFYAILLTMALISMGDPINQRLVWDYAGLRMNHPLNQYLAWGYAGLRIVHSLIQCTINIVRYRFAAFSLASLCLLALTFHTGARILHDCLVIID